jgi:hypothetical protein
MLLSANFSEVEAIAQKKVTDLPRILRFNFGIWVEICRTRPTLSPAIQAVDNNTRLADLRKRKRLYTEVPYH